MELLPIIYTSLIIVSVLITATIIISFVSYKIRQNREGNLKVYEKFPAGNKKVSKSPKPRPQSPKQEEHKSKRERNVREKEKPEPSQRKKPSSNREKNIKEKFEKPFTTLKRIEIIDELKPVKKVTTAPPKEQSKETSQDKNKRNKMHTLGDDVLNKYADNDDDDFHHLSVDK